MPHRSLDLVAVMIVTTVAVALALLGLDSGIVPIVLGVPLALFFPGYALVALFAPVMLSRPTRMLLSFGLSLGLTAIGRFVFNWTPWGLHISSWAVFLGGATLGAAAVALSRRTPKPEGVPARRPGALHPLMLFAVAGTVVTIIVLAQTGATQRVSAAFIQFWPVPMVQPSPATTLIQEALASASLAPAATAAATATPTPPPATATSTPTALPSPLATATAPTSSPTPQPSNTLVASRLNIALSDWPTRATNTASLKYEDDQYRLRLNGQPSVSVASVIPADNYRLSIDIDIDEGQAGVIFLAMEPTMFYRIMFNTEGAYAIEQVQQNSDEAALLVDWTASTALQSPDTIHVQVERQGETIQFFADNQPLTTFAVPPGRVTNQAGVALADASGRGQATFTNLVVEQLQSP